MSMHFGLDLLQCNLSSVARESVGHSTLSEENSLIFKSLKVENTHAIPDVGTSY